MKIANIDEIAYTLSEYRKSDRGAIVFLGAGASATAGIPLANKVLADVIDQYGNSPAINRLSKAEQQNYFKVMSCLDDDTRKSIFIKYIDEAKINITHIYLAQLIKEGYVDFVLTVNFDNLIQRALALFNIFPATYDLAALSKIPTSDFTKPGVIFLHGQHQSFKLLNTETGFSSIKEMVDTTIRKLYNRPWIILGYSASDKIFDSLKSISFFGKSLYWVCYRENDPPQHVITELLNEELDKNASIVKGEDSDSFMFNLHAQLTLKVPDIISAPFTYIESVQTAIADINSGKYKGVKERLEITKKWIYKTIVGFENGQAFNTKNAITQKEIKIDKIRLEIFDSLSKNDNYLTFQSLVTKYLKRKNKLINEALGTGFNSWAVDISDSHLRVDISAWPQLWEKSCGLYAKAASLYPGFDLIYENWSYDLVLWSRLTTGSERKFLLTDALKKAVLCVENGGNIYNMGCINALLGKKKLALKYLEQALLNKTQSLESVIDDEDWKAYKNDEDFNRIITKFRNS